MNRKTAFFIIVALQVLVLIGIIAFKYSVLFSSRTVVLESVPIDPRDLLRGDYVQIRLDITSLNARSLYHGERNFKVGDKIFVVLQKNSPAWQPLRIVFKLFDPGPEQALIKGKVTSVNRNYLRVDYGVDSYYVPEGRGREFERNRLWEVSVNRRGDAVLKGPLGLK